MIPMTNVHYTKAMETGIILSSVDIFFSNNVPLYVLQQAAGKNHGK